MKLKCFLLLLIFYSNCFSQNEQDIIGSWTFSGRDMFLFDFSNNGEVSITSYDFNNELKDVSAKWKISDGNLYINYTKKKEQVLKIIELNNIKMVVESKSKDIASTLILYKIEKKEKLNIDIKESFFNNNTYIFKPKTTIGLFKISFKPNGKCVTFLRSTTNEIVSHESSWRILKKQNNLLLYIYDAEVLIIKNKIQRGKGLKLESYGAFRIINNIEKVKMIRIKN